MEGKGDVVAVSNLLRKILQDRYGRYDIQVLPGHKATRSRLAPDTIRAEIEYAHRVVRGGADWVVVIYDIDDDCAADHAAKFPTDLRAVLAIAVREYEAWFIADSDDPARIAKAETVRGAKEEMTKILGRKYSSTIDARKMSSQIDVERVERNSRSFRHLVKVVGELIQGSD